MKKCLYLLIALLAFVQTAWAQNIVSVNYVDENGATQTVNATSLDHIASVNPNGANIGSTGFTNWYVVQGNDVVLNGQLGYNGGINLILCDGAKLTINKTDGDAIASLDNTGTTTTMTIYVQSGGTGQLVATGSGAAIHTENLAIHGGVITATGGTRGIYAPQNNIVINGGTVTAVAPNGNAIEGYNVTINGGIVSATGNGGIQNGMTGTTTLGYTKNTDRITATSYLLGQTAAIKVKEGQYMITENGVIVYGSLNENKRNAIAGHTLSPYTPTEWSGSGDSAIAPYIIASVDDLNLLSLRTNGGGNDYSNKFFRLDADITYTTTSNWNDATSAENNFTAIAGFNGYFDGNGHTISGLRIYANDNYHDQNGLFSNLGPNAYIENVTLSNARITGQAQVGGIAGNVQNGATIANCHVTNTVAVHAWGHTLQYHGGIAGVNYGTITNCVSEATISMGSYTYGSENVGGIAGANNGTISGNKVFNAYITAAQHYGAIAGSNDGGTLTNNYYRATVNGIANATDVGCDGADIPTNDGALSLHTITKPSTINIVTSATITYNNINYWAQGKTITLSGGLDDTPTDGWQKAYFVNGEANTSDAFTPSDTFTITPAEDITITVGEIHADWATVQTGTFDNPYKIYFTDQLDLLSTRVNNGNNYSSKYFQLMNNLAYDNTEQNNYTAIGTSSHSFGGYFNGDSKAISGIRISGSYQGVFGAIENGSIANLIVADAEICGTDHTGVIAGINNGSTLTNNYYLNCSVNGITTGIGCNGADVTANDGARPVFTVTVPDGVTATATATVTYNTVNYYKEGVTITLSGGLTGETTPGTQKTYSVYGEPLLTSSLAPTNTFTMQAANAVVTLVETPIDWATEEGAGNTEENPYKIYFPEQLDLLAARVNTGTDYAGKYFKLMDNLTYNYQGLEATESNYTAIGNNDLPYDPHPFKGHFDGNGKTINGIRIYKGGSNMEDKYQGVFGYLDDDDSEVKNLTVSDAIITAFEHVGGIVGNLRGGIVTNCHATSTVVIGSVKTTAQYLGGIVGQAESNGNTAATISDCTSSATLSPAGYNGYYFGGIVGRLYGYVNLSHNFAIGATIPAASYDTHGAIVGYSSESSNLTNNYFRNCTVAGVTPGVGCSGDNITDNDGALPVFTLSVDENITADVTVSITYNEVNYYKLGATVALSYVTPADPGYHHVYSVNGTPIEGDSFNMEADAEVTVVLNQVTDWAIENTGNEGDPYLILTADQWDMLATRVNEGNSYEDKFFKLMEDISVTTMVGTGSNKFSGTFDGNGHTLTFNKESGNQYIAPFRYINSATIQNLKVTGTVTSSDKFAGGIVAHATGSNTITNCVNSTIINATIAGNGSHGGILGQLGGSNNSVTISGCIFNGKMLGTNTDYWCGIIGYFDNSSTSNNSVTISNCFFNPEEISVKSTDDNYTICRSGATVSNCYYNTAAATMYEKQGKQARIITGGTNVTVAFAGNAEVYDVSGISGYGIGISLTRVISQEPVEVEVVLYAGKSESLQLDITFTGNLLPHTSPVYTVTNGSLSGIVLTLNNDNSSTVTVNYDHYVIDEWSGSGTEADPYLIYTSGQWNLLAERVNNGTSTYSGKFFKLMGDISIRAMIDYSGDFTPYRGFNPEDVLTDHSKLVGNSETNSFQGTFDGNGHTIHLNYYDIWANDHNSAPFRFVKNATIKRLTVDGEIAQERDHQIAGIVGSSYGTTNIISCRSNANIGNNTS